MLLAQLKIPARVSFVQKFNPSVNFALPPKAHLRLNLRSGFDLARRFWRYGRRGKSGKRELCRKLGRLNRFVKLYKKVNLSYQNAYLARDEGKIWLSYGKLHNFKAFVYLFFGRI
jgi:hypothetical protein